MEFGSRFAEKSTSEVEIFEKENYKKTKIKIEIEIDLIYDSKLKYNVIRRKIRTKNQFLTQDSALIELILCQVKGFSFANSKTIVGVQESISPILSMKSYFQTLYGCRN